MYKIYIGIYIIILCIVEKLCVQISVYMQFNGLSEVAPTSHAYIYRFEELKKQRNRQIGAHACEREREREKLRVGAAGGG